MGKHSVAVTFSAKPADLRLHLPAEFGQDRVIMAQIFGVAGRRVQKFLGQHF